jgi:hypothetical protein
MNAGKGMTLGVLIAAVIAFAISTVTDDQTIWSWAIPVGIAVGLAIGAGGKR